MALKQKEEDSQKFHGTQGIFKENTNSFNSVRFEEQIKGWSIFLQHHAQLENYRLIPTAFL